MKIKNSSLLLFLVMLPLAVFGYTTNDTIKINELNAKAFDLAYSNPKQGLVLVKQAIQLSQKSGFVKGEVLALIRRGIIYDVTDQPQLALKSYNEALTLAEKINFKLGIGASYSNIGLIHLNQHDLSAAMIAFQKAQDIFESLHNNIMLSSVANNIGMIYEETNRPNAALKSFFYGLKSADKVENLNAKANLYAGISGIYGQLEKIDSAIYFSQKAIDIYSKTDNIYYLGKSYNNLGLIYMRQKDYKTAELYFIKAVAIARQIENNPMLVSSGFNLSQIYNHTKQPEKQGKILYEIYPLISSEGMEELAYKTCLSLAKWNYRNGSAQKGDAFMSEFIENHQKYYDQVSNQQLNDIEKKYEVDKKNKENQLLKKANQLKSLTIKKNKQSAIIVNLFWTSGVILLLLITILIIFYFRKKSYQKGLENQQAVFDATLAERKRISFDLHDNVGSQLSYVVNNLEMLNQHSQKEPTINSERIERTFKMSQEAIDSLRDTVWALHNAAITTELLVSKMEQFTRKVVDSKEITLNFSREIHCNQIIAPEQTMHIFRIFQEAINNVCKHAQATQIDILFFESLEGNIALKISDNGKGITCKDSPAGHYGLKNMLERAKHIGAILTIGKVETGGTQISLDIPFLK